MARSRRNEGYVTLAVLVIAGLLAAIVSTLFAVSRPALGLARIGADEIIAESLVDGGLNAAGYLLFMAKQEAASVSGRTLRFRGGTVRLHVVDESGRIDINAADPVLLAGLFAAVGGTSLQPDSFAARVVDWRDEDTERGDGGAEADEYSAAELGYGPPDGRFRSAEDLRLVLGLSRGDFGRLLPFVTIFSASRAIDPFSAPMTVLRAVPELDEDQARRIVRAREAGPQGAEALAALLANYANYFRAEPSRVYRVGIQARLDSGFIEAAEAVIIAPADEGGNFRVVAWSRPANATRPR